MSSNTLSSRKRVGLTMSMITLFAGITGFLYQFLTDGTMLTIMVGLAAIGGLAGSSKSFDEPDREILNQCYAIAFQYLLAALFLVYVFVVFSSWLHLAAPVTEFINSHWLGSMVAAMCIFLGIPGVRKYR